MGDNNRLAFLKIHLNDKQPEEDIPNFELKEICWF
jgi:hypothetical protein